MLQREQNSTSALQSTPPVPPVSWTGDAVTMATAMTRLLLEHDTDRIAKSLAMLWVRGIVDTLFMLKRDAGAFAAITAAPAFRADQRLMAALDVVEGRQPKVEGLFPDQAIEFQAMHDVPNWPKIIGPDAPPLVLKDAADLVQRDPRYYDALYDAIRRNRAMAGEYLLRSVKARPKDHVPGGYIYVGPSHKGDQPDALDVPDAKRKAVNEAIWKELGVGEGTQASINTWDTAKFSFGPGFAATGLLRSVMDNLAKAGADALVPLKAAGLVYQNGTWFVVDPATRTVRSGREALDLLSQDRGLIGTFLDTAGDTRMRKQWMDAEWQAMMGGSGAAAVPKRVVENWPIDLIVFVAHCVHWGGRTWKQWESDDPPAVFEVVRTQARSVGHQKDPRVLTLLSANTFRSFAGGLLMKTLREQGRRQDTPVNLPDDWNTGFAGAVALPASATKPVFHLIEADE
ncbi:hypothetical protein FLP10_03690 [Agromyces intestinalis]|uniref:Uncharacterized protein n=1 Tax=Agromyces intestinalis TaxID=2592652 RepID=A0A5C1YC11_9MICO|nr:hypothetical protein [Agromyces intestinalis]QEO13623.1 hypothetical protein FLP10_03690 [Agromyces intestinalis]